VSSTQRIETIKKWTPRAASAVIIIFSFLVFGGIVNFVMKYLGIGEYFSVPSANEAASADSIKERNTRMNEFLKERTQKRQDASMPRTLGEGEKDPFNLP